MNPPSFTACWDSPPTMSLSWQARHHATARTSPMCMRSWSYTRHQHCLCVLAGMILRSTIVKLLQHRIGLFTADANGDIPPAKSHVPTTQQVLLVTSSLLHEFALQWQVLESLGIFCHVLETLEVVPQQVMETLELLPQQFPDGLGARVEALLRTLPSLHVVTLCMVPYFVHYQALYDTSRLLQELSSLLELLKQHHLYSVTPTICCRIYCSC